MNVDLGLLHILESNIDPCEIEMAARAIASDIDDPAARCRAIADAIRKRGEKSAREIVGALSCELDSQQLKPDLVIVIVAALSTLFDLRRWKDGHPLAHSVGHFSTSREVDSELAEFCMSLEAWSEELVTSISSMDIAACGKCITGVSFVLTWWLWERSFCVEIRQFPKWYAEWLNALRRAHPEEWKLVSRKLRIRFPEFF